MMSHTTQYGFNAVNRGVYIADNLDFLRTLNDECIDLVCIDPPFAKNGTFIGNKVSPPIAQQELDIELALLKRWGIESPEAAASLGIVWPETPGLSGGYTDIWSWEKDIHESWVKDIEEDHPSIHALVEATRLVHGDSIAAYLCYMAIRILEIHRILKPSGSIFLHCDHTANAYIRQLLDGIFGDENFRNELTWSYGGRGAKAISRQFPRNHDTILLYSKNPSTRYEKVYEEVRYPVNNLPSHIKIEQDGIPFKTAPRGDYTDASIERLRREGRVHQTSTGAIRIKYYLQRKGSYVIEQKMVGDVWSDIPDMMHQSKDERTGYPTQKPIALAERIIQSSTQPGDVVLDCFAGCAYTSIAAERLGRSWVACDFNPRAWTVVKRQFSKPKLAVLTCNDGTTGQQVLIGEQVTVHGPTQLPTRTSPDKDIAPDLATRREPPERVFKVPASIIPESEMLKELLELSGYMAWCCGYANRMPDGTIVRTTRNFHLDHIAPKTKEGTSNEIQNRAPMCPYHNIRKQNRQIALSAYRQEIAMNGEMLVGNINDLINLDRAFHQANQIYGRAWAKKNQAND